MKTAGAPNTLTLREIAAALGWPTSLKPHHGMIALLARFWCSTDMDQSLVWPQKQPSERGPSSSLQYNAVHVPALRAAAACVEAASPSLRKEMHRWM